MEDQAEVTGPADKAFLSNLAPFRLANSEVKATAKPRTVSSSTGSEANSSLMTACPPPPITSQSREFLMPSIGTGAGGDEVFLTSGAQLAPGMVPATQQQMPESGVINTLSPSMEEYIGLAGEMSSYISWDISVVPSWMEFDPDTYHL